MNIIYESIICGHHKIDFGVHTLQIKENTIDDITYRKKIFRIRKSSGKNSRRTKKKDLHSLIIAYIVGF